MSTIKRTMTLEEAQQFCEASINALNEGCPVKSPLLKTVEGLHLTLSLKAKELRDKIAEKVEKWEDNKPVYKEGVTEQEYLDIINESRKEEIEVSIETVSATSNYILPNGGRIRLEDYLEKAVNVSAKMFSLLKEFYIK